MKHTFFQQLWYRRLVVLFPLLIVLFSALLAITWLDNALLRGITYAPDPSPIEWADVPSLGVNAYNIQYEPDPQVVTQTLELAHTMGARFVRIQMPWEDIEQSKKGDFYDHKHNIDAWEKYDRIVATANRLGLQLIVRIDRPPSWARTQAIQSPQFQQGLAENGNSTGPPDKFSDYADFVQVVANRYRGKVQFLQLWNEPNLSYEWNWNIPDPESFVELLQQAYTAAKTTNPDVVILFPSLAPTDGLEPRIAPMSELEYLDRVYKAGGKTFFDIMSAQAYGLGQPPDEHAYIFLRKPNNWKWNRPIDTRIDVSRLVLVREVMERNNDSNKAIWISEFGYNSAPPELQAPQGDTAWGKAVTEEQKGEYLIGQLERARREWPWVGVMNVWFLRWGGPDPDPRDTTPYFATVSRDFTPLPAYNALQSYMEQGAVAGIGTHRWQHPAVTQLGSDQWQVRFEGTSFSFEDLTHPISISIDEATAQPFQPLVGGGEIVVAQNLTDTTHTITIQSKDFPSQYFRVGRTTILGWVLPSLMLLLILGLMLIGIVIADTIYQRTKQHKRG